MQSETTILNHPVSRGIFYLLMATTPFYYWRHQFPVLPFDWVVALVLFVIVGIYLVAEKRAVPVLSNRLNIWFILFLLSNTISTILSPYLAFAFSQMDILFQGYLFIVINLFFMDEKSIFEKVPLVLGISIGLNSLIASLGYFFGMTFMNTWEEEVGTYGVTSGANSQALMCVFVIPLLVYCLRFAKTKAAFLFYLALIAINFCGLISSESRGGFLNFCLLSILIIIFNRNLFRPKMLGIVVSGIAFLTVTVAFAIPDSYFERQKSLLAENKDLSLLRRAAYVRVSLRSFMENPILGTGTRTFPIIWENSKETLMFLMKRRNNHNTYLNVLVGTGLVGLFIFFGLLYQTFKDLLFSIRQFDLAGDEYAKGMTTAYFISFITLAFYGFMKNIMDNKLFLLILPVSQILYYSALDLKNKMSHD